MIDTSKLVLYMKPAGYSAGKLNTAIPRGGYFTVTRNSGKNRIGSDGYYRWIAANVPAVDYKYGTGVPMLNTEPSATNLLLYPFAAEHSSYTKFGLTVELDPSTAGSELFAAPILGTGWVDNTGGSYSIDGTQTAASALTVAAALTLYKSYKYEVTISSWVAGTLTVKAGTQTKILSADGTYVFYLYDEGTTDIVLSADVDLNATVSAISTKEVSAFSSPFKDVSGNILLKGRKLVESLDTSAGNHRMYFAYFGTPSTTYSISWILKSAGRSRVFISIGGIGLTDGSGPDVSAVVDLNDGSIVVDGNSISVKELADGFWKVSIKVTTGTTGSISPYIDIVESGTIRSYQGDGTSGIYVSGLYFKEGIADSFPNDAEATEGAMVTRLADDISVTPPSGVTKITETFGDGTTNVITTIPSTYTLATYTDKKYELIEME